MNPEPKRIADGEALADHVAGSEFGPPHEMIERVVDGIATREEVDLVEEEARANPALAQHLEALRAMRPAPGRGRPWLVAAATLAAAAAVAAAYVLSRPDPPLVPMAADTPPATTQPVARADPAPEASGVAPPRTTAPDPAGVQPDAPPAPPTPPIALPAFASTLLASTAVRGPGPFALVSPAGTAVDTPRPTFQWEPRGDADQYEVLILDTDARVVASGLAESPAWTPGSDLPREQVLQWRVEAILDDGARLAATHAGPRPARFYVLSLADAKTWAGSGRLSLLERGRLAARLGLLHDAETLLAAAATRGSEEADDALLQLRRAIRGDAE